MPTTASKQSEKTTSAKQTTAAAPPANATRYCAVRRPAPLKLNKSVGSKRARLIHENSNKWVAGTTLNYYFYDKDTDGAYVKMSDGSKQWRPWKGTKKQTDVVRKAFKIWKDTGLNLVFKEVGDRKDADIRIAFMEDDGAWSYIGRDIRTKRKDPRTMNFGWDISVKDRHNGIDTALHEIGHTLGFPHEHQNPYAGIVWNEEAVYEDLGGYPNYWSKATTYGNIIEKLSTKEVTGTTWDPDSIMHYPFKKGLMKKPEMYAGKDLNPAGGFSKLDVQYAVSLYPQKNPVKDILVSEMNSYPIDAANSEQQNFIFRPVTTKKYTVQTVGELDTVLVVSEQLSGKETAFVASDDNGGTNKNALVSVKLFKGKTYLIKVKVYFKKSGAKTALMIS